MNVTKTPDGLEIYNPLSHGIHGLALMVKASEHNQRMYEYESQLATMTLECKATAKLVEALSDTEQCRICNDRCRNCGKLTEQDKVLAAYRKTQIPQ